MTYTDIYAKITADGYIEKIMQVRKYWHKLIDELGIEYNSRKFCWNSGEYDIKTQDNKRYIGSVERPVRENTRGNAGIGDNRRTRLRAVRGRISLNCFSLTFFLLDFCFRFLKLIRLSTELHDDRLVSVVPCVFIKIGGNV